MNPGSLTNRQLVNMIETDEIIKNEFVRELTRRFKLTMEHFEKVIKETPVIPEHMIYGK